MRIWLTGFGASLLISGSAGAEPPSCPERVGVWSPAAIRAPLADDPAPPVDAVDVAVAGRVVAVADATYGSSRLRLLDGSDPCHPIELGGVGLPGNATAVALSPGLAAVTHSTIDWDICVDGGLTLVDIRAPARPLVVSTLPLDSCVEDVAIGSGVAYVVNDGDLVVVDIADPEHPVTTAHYRPELIHAWRVAVQDRTLFVADLFGKLCTADLSDPSIPRHIGCAVVTHDNLVALAVFGDLLAAISRPDPPNPHELVLVNVASPLQPIRLSATATAGRADDVALVGGIAAVGLGFDGGVQIFEVYDPVRPASVGIAGPLGTRNHRLTLAGNRLWLAENLEGVAVFRIDACQLRRTGGRSTPTGGAAAGSGQLPRQSPGRRD